MKTIMASGKKWTNICTDCGRHVEILNGDFDFSMELHKQSHKSLDDINNALDRNLNYSKENMDNSTKLNLNYCHDCNESFEIINNDLSSSFQLHARKHKMDNTDALSDHSSTSSRTSKGYKKVIEEKQQTQPVVTSMLDAIFHTMPMGLKAHRSFISEQGCSKAICNLCEISIEPIFSASEHLKTKQHEDNTISLIKATLSSELHDQMEFISFYGSNLCCNLCRYKIDLCSENLHKTALNIIIHNAGKGHSSKRTLSKDNNHPDKTLFILKSLALLDPLVGENQHLIEHNMRPYFKCKPCDKQIAYSENHNDMANKLKEHFNSQAHVKYLNAVSLLSKWGELNIAGKENHSFVVAKQYIFCSSCNCNVGTTLDQLLAHIRTNAVLQEAMKSELSPRLQAIHLPDASCSSTSQNKINIKSQAEENINKQPMNQQLQPQNLSDNYRRLIQCLPAQLQCMVTTNKKGEAVCSVCKCTIPSTTYNLTTHFNGSAHKKKENEAKLSVSSKSYSMQAKRLGTQAKGTTAHSGIEFDLASNQQRVAANTEYFVKYGGENKYICTLCNTIFHEDGNLQKNILSHTENQDHIYKIQLKEEMSKLGPKHSEFLVKELFNTIPMSYQKDMKYIKAPVAMNFVFCEICNIKIPSHKYGLVQHLEGVYHITSVERFGKIHSNKVPVPESKPTNLDVLFQEVLKSHTEIKNNSKYLEKTNDDYICKLCKAVIKSSYDKNLLEANLLSHLKGKKHQKNIEDEFSSMLDKTQISSELVRNNRKFLKGINDRVICTLCSIYMSMADNVESLRYNLEVHLSGSTHRRKLESEASVPPASSREAELTPAQRYEKAGVFWDHQGGQFVSLEYYPG